MTRSTYAVACAFAAALLSINVGAAQAMSSAQPLSSSSPSLPPTLSSVFCGATGCMPVTRVKRCAPDTVNQGLPGQRAIVVHRTCNFL